MAPRGSQVPMALLDSTSTPAMPQAVAKNWFYGYVKRIFTWVNMDEWLKKYGDFFSSGELT